MHFTELNTSENMLHLSQVYAFLWKEDQFEINIDTWYKELQTGEKREQVNKILFEKNDQLSFPYLFLRISIKAVKVYFYFCLMTSHQCIVTM